jgi:S1/P1 Nuclease
MDLHRFWDGVITSSSNLTRLRNEATALRNRQEFQRSQLTELVSTNFESWAKESFEIATKIAYRNGVLTGSPRAGNKDCTTITAAPVLPVGYISISKRIAERRMILAGYRLVDLLTRLILEISGEVDWSKLQIRLMLPITRTWRQQRLLFDPTNTESFR